MFENRTHLSSLQRWRQYQHAKRGSGVLDVIGHKANFGLA